MALIEFVCDKCSQPFGVMLHQRGTVGDVMAEIRQVHAQHSPACGRQFGAVYCRRRGAARVANAMSVVPIDCSVRPAGTRVAVTGNRQQLL